MAFIKGTAWDSGQMLRRLSQPSPARTFLPLLALPPCQVLAEGRRLDGHRGCVSGFQTELLFISCLGPAETESYPSSTR